MKVAVLIKYYLHLIVIVFLTSFLIGPGQVNDINFENMSNDDAVRVLREIVHKPG